MILIKINQQIYLFLINELSQQLEITMRENRENAKLNKALEDGISDLEMSRTDQAVILLVSLLTLILAIVGFLISDMMYLFITL